LGSFRFDRLQSNYKMKKGRRKWFEELREEITRDIQAEIMEQ
jgi:hypothetical protein